MKSEATTVEEYVNSLSEDRKAIINTLRKVVKKNLPKGFTEEMNYGMIGYVVPLSIYPKGYLGDKHQPLPFMNIASQKNNIALYHMGIYSDCILMNWFKEEYKATYSKKLDMGKSCLRFRSMENIPFELIGTLSTKVTVEQWISQYEHSKQKKQR